MSIQQKKIEKIANDIIAVTLKQGYVPSSDEVINRIAEALRKNDPSSPFYEYKKLTALTAQDINQAKDLERTDINLLLSAVYEIYERVVEQGRKITVERECQERRFNELETVLRRLSTLYATPGYVSGYVNALSAVSLFDNDLTTAMIDIINNEMTLPAHDMQLTQNYSLQLVTTGIQQNGSLINLTKLPGLPWMGYTFTSSRLAAGDMKIQILATLREPINRMQLELPMLKPVSIVIEEAQTAGNYSHVLTRTTSGSLSCQIKPASRYVRITFSKLEADKFDSANGKYYYYFLIDTLLFYQVKHLSSGYFQTKPVSIPNDADKLLFLAEDEQPASTRITYYVSSDATTWSEVRSGEEIMLSSINKNIQKDIINSADLATESFRARDLRGNIYRLGNIVDTDIANPRLYKGSNCWKETSIALIPNDNAGSGPLYKGFYNTLKETRNAVIQYNTMDRGQPTFVYNQRTILGTYLYHARTTAVRGQATLEKYSITHSYPLTIYLNGRVIYAETATTTPREVNWNFIKGNNDIELIMNIDLPNQVVGGESQSILTVNLGINLMQSSRLVYADEKPCERMSLFNLQYNSIGKPNSFAVESDDQDTTIYINQSDVHVPYRIVYDAISRRDNIIYLAGELYSPNKDLTPKLSLLEVRHC